MTERGANRVRRLSPSRTLVTLRHTMPTRWFRKLLIANRGEIALRIIRTARTMDLATVAVFSDADAAALYTAAADEAIRIGGPEPHDSYLNIDSIIGAARATQADAIHPGYGFLSERPEFASAVADAGLAFVGPPAEVMAALGDKLSAKKLATVANVPVVPGIDVPDLASARRFGASAGYPILVKAAAGGGGRGMRIVSAEGELESALEAASREAQAAFGDGRIFLEKYLARPRHIEIQLLADAYGRVIALGERDCSIQRRHQKLIEESPAPGLSEALRSRIIDAALRLASAAKYRNAGTAEFLVEGDQFYFLEVNARLQVEHPVTELRFGRDLVADQLAIAAGEHVEDVTAPRGHAIECRINAEDAMNDFRPATGKILDLILPDGPGVRVDTQLARGIEISPYYDSLLAKLICWGGDREQARRRLLSALDEFTLLGVQSAAGFLRDVIASRPFAAADLSTRFLPEHFPQWRPDRPQIKAAALLAAAVPANHSGSASRKDAARAVGGDASSPWTSLGGFEPWHQ